MADVGTVVLGAGPAGLATAARLRKLDVDFLVLDAGTGVGASWRGHYERLHLHTPKQHSSLPGMPMGAELPEYPSRLEVVDYLERYAAAFGIEPRFGERADRIARADERWTVETPRASYRADHVVVATGYNHEPYAPDWEGRERFEGRVIHSREYENGEPFRGQRVLVVGARNTGAEIALCLHEHGAESIALCVRGSLDVVPRKFLGVPITSWAIWNEPLPLPVRDAIGRVVSRLSYGDLRGLGLVPSGHAIRRIVEEGVVPLIDVGTVDLIRSGRVRVVGAIDRFTERGVVAGGESLELDAVILATGYRTGLASLLDEPEAVLDERGYPTTRGSESELPGLYFVGFSNPPTGLLRGIGIDAERAATSIRSKMP